MIRKTLNPVLLGIVFLTAACTGVRPGIASAPASPIADRSAMSDAADHAYAMVGAPYRQGGIDPAGFDCSGLVHYSFRKVGIALPRTTQGLQKIGVEVEPHALAKGDLLFFDQEGKKASHVAIYLGEGRFVHAPSTGGKVRADALDFPYWRRHFTAARRP